MRRLTFILLFFCFLQLNAQESKGNYNFALINFDLTDSKLSFEDQETFLSALLSLGDKEIILEEIFYRLLKSQDFSTQDSILQVYLKSFKKKDKKAIDKYPKIVPDWREIAFHSVRVIYMGQAYVDSITLSEAYLNILKNKSKYFPNMPQESIENKVSVTSDLKKHLDYTKWIVNYPEEYKYFDDLLKEQTFRFLKSKKEEDVIKFVNHVKNNAISNNSVDEQSIPPSIEIIFKYYEIQKIRNLKFVALCNPKEIDLFISEAYELIFRNQIPANSLVNLSKHIKENNLYDPELIYLAILLSKYE